MVRRARKRKCLIAGAILCGCLGIGAWAAWRFPQALLCVDTGYQPADAILVLGGGSYERSTRAAELFKERAAPRIFITGKGDWERNQRALVEKGVPERLIEVETMAESTWENAGYSVPRLRAKGVKRVILVTSWFHSRRALQCFRRAAPEMEFYSCPSHFAMERPQWPQAGPKNFIWVEYGKTLYYFFRYGLLPC